MVVLERVLEQARQLEPREHVAAVVLHRLEVDTLAPDRHRRRRVPARPGWCTRGRNQDRFPARAGIRDRLLRAARSGPGRCPGWCGRHDARGACRRQFDRRGRRRAQSPASRSAVAERIRRLPHASCVHGRLAPQRHGTAPDAVSRHRQASPERRARRTPRRRHRRTRGARTAAPSSHPRQASDDEEQAGAGEINPMLRHALAEGNDAGEGARTARNHTTPKVTSGADRRTRKATAQPPQAPRVPRSQVDRQGT